METRWSVIRMCSGAVWEMSEGQEVTEAGFMAVNMMTSARSEMTSCIYHGHMAAMLMSR